MTIAQLKAMLANVEAKINEVLTTGQEYTVVGSHSIKNPSLAELEQQASNLRRRILLYRGVTSRTFPNFGD
jgi:copper homeostasis protein CutC